MKSDHKLILEQLAKLCEKYPQQRFGQILFNYTMIGQRSGLGNVRDPFHYSDADFAKNIGDL